MMDHEELLMTDPVDQQEWREALCSVDWVQPVSPLYLCVQNAQLMTLMRHGDGEIQIYGTIQDTSVPPVECRYVRLARYNQPYVFARCVDVREFTYLRFEIFPVILQDIHVWLGPRDGRTPQPWPAPEYR